MFLSKLLAYLCCFSLISLLSLSMTHAAPFQDDLIIAQGLTGNLVIPGFATKSVQLQKSGVVIFKAIPESLGLPVKFRYYLNGKRLDITRYRFNIITVEAGDVLTAQNLSPYEDWMEYYQNYTLFIVIVGCIIAAIFGVVVNGLMYLASRRSKRVNLSPDRMLLMFWLSVAMFMSCTLGILYHPTSHYLYFTSIAISTVMLIPVENSRKLRLAALMIGLGSLNEIILLSGRTTFNILPIYVFNGINQVMGSCCLILSLFALAVHTGMKLSHRITSPRLLHLISLCDRRISYGFVVVTAMIALMSYICFFVAQEWMTINPIPFALVILVGATRTLLTAKRNELQVELQKSEIEEKNARLEAQKAELLDLNQNLEIKVMDKTRDIKGLLDNIPQGVLSVDPQLNIMKEYSAELPIILQRSDIGGRSFVGVVIDVITNLTVDEKDQFLQALTSILGQSALFFDANADKLPRLIKYKTRWLSCTYKAVTGSDRDDTVSRVLVTLLDISKEKEAEKTAEAEKLKLAIVKELIGVTPARSIEFFASSRRFLESASRGIEQGAGTMKAIQDIMVALHTVKGMSRSYSMKNLSEQIHRAEHVYSDILKGDDVFIPARARDEFQYVMESFELYYDINTNILGRQGERDRMTVDKDFLRSHFHLLTRVKDHIKSDAALCQEISREKDRILDLALHDASSVIRDALSEASQIAQQLAKEPPDLIIEGGPIRIDGRQRNAINHAFIHIVRNALDHGIESTAERLAQGKPSQSRICVQLRRLEGDRFAIRLSDDGRGLDVESIKARGLAQGLIPEGALAPEIANLIFSSGFSTAARVTETSGRGVGMEAVRGFFEQLSGTVHVELGRPKDRFNQFFDFELVMELPLSEAI